MLVISLKDMKCKLVMLPLRRSINVKHLETHLLHSSFFFVFSWEGGVGRALVEESVNVSIVTTGLDDTAIS